MRNKEKDTISIVIGKHMPELSEKEQRQLFRYSTAVANDKEKYIAFDLTNSNAMKEYFSRIL